MDFLIPFFITLFPIVKDIIAAINNATKKVTPKLSIDIPLSNSHIGLNTSHNPKDNPNNMYTI